MTLPKRLQGAISASAENALKTIGELIVAANDLDVSLTALLGGFIGGTERRPQETILHVISFAQKIAVFRSILKIKQTPFTQGVLKNVERAEVLMRTRDAVAHGMLLFEDSKFILAQIGLPKILATRRSQKGPLRVESLSAVSDEMVGLAEWFIERTQQIEQHRLEPSGNPPP